jgi:conjugal transfer pilus assembly protein TraV
VKKAFRAISFITGFSLLSGCAIINPYDSEFSCPETSSRGKCVSVNNAYKEASTSNVLNLAETKADKPDEQKDGESNQSEEDCSQHLNSDDPVNGDNLCAKNRKNADSTKDSKETQNYNRYRSALYDKFGKLLKEPKTPVVSPPKTMRVLLLPYTGQENEFYMMRHVYFFVDEPRWILGDSVSSSDDEEE